MNSVPPPLWRERVVHSALWGAAGDALGFMTELADERMVKRRTGFSRTEAPIPWTRLVGGRYGASVSFPAGSYSDDTQLRLAVSRSINGIGFFDVEAFAKLELPLWLSYFLGAGFSSKTASENLTKKTVGWNTNFYQAEKTKYLSAGGNGAAMRIQPHVWSHKATASRQDMLLGIIQDTIVTHGHCAALIGACVHGITLLDALECGPDAALGDYLKHLSLLQEIPAIIERDSELGLIWKLLWEKESSESFREAFERSLSDYVKDAEKLHDLSPPKSLEEYSYGVDVLQGFNPETRGSGIKCALISSFLASSPNGTEEILSWAANCLGSDTDTIASMSGCLRGASKTDPLRWDIQDRSYIESEASRMAELRFGKATRYFEYPSKDSWKFSLKKSGVMYESGDGEYNCAVFGRCIPLSDIYWIHGRKNEGYQWFKTNFDQSIVIKRTEKLMKLIPPVGSYTALSNSERHPTDYVLNITIPTNVADKAMDLTIDKAYEDVRQGGFRSEQIGDVFLRLVSQENGVDKAIAFAALVSKAIKTRSGRPVR